MKESWEGRKLPTNVGSSYRPPRAVAKDLSPGSFHWLRVFAPDQPGYPWIIGGAAALGFLYLVLGPSPDANRLLVAKFRSVRVTLGSQVRVPPGFAIRDSVVLLEFPEIPYQKAFLWKDLLHPQGADFKLALDFRCLAPPSHLSVSVLQPGLRTWKSSSLELVNGTADLTLPEIALYKDTPAPEPSRREQR